MIFAIMTTNIGDKPVDDELQQAQRRYFERLVAHDVLVAAGPFDDDAGGMLLVEVESVEEAIDIARAVPTVRAGRERYQVRGWGGVYDPASHLRHDKGVAPRPNKSGPMIMPPSEENFSIVDITDDPDHTDVTVQCLAKDQICLDDRNRNNYLTRARERGLHKLLLLHDNAVAGQIEFSPPEGAALPIRGEHLAVINCLWVLDAFTGLDGGRRLLASAATAMQGTQGLATVAFNSNLGWLPQSFFEEQGFVVVDSMETRRFIDNTPIAAYLMWRSLTPEATPPTWDREQLENGVDFCPAYPWLFGQRRYWGRNFAYRGRLVKEGLRRPELLDQLPVLAEKRIDPWTLVEVGIPEADLERGIESIQRALISEPMYYGYVYHTGDRDEVIVIYPYRDYRVTKDPRSWEDAIRYGLDKGVPKEELIFEAKPL